MYGGNPVPVFQPRYMSYSSLTVGILSFSVRVEFVPETYKRVFQWRIYVMPCRLSLSYQFSEKSLQVAMRQGYKSLIYLSIFISACFCLRSGFFSELSSFNCSILGLPKLMHKLVWFKMFNSGWSCYLAFNSKFQVL